MNPDHFVCKCGCGGGDISPLLLEKLQEAERLAGINFEITSGVRCASHNKRVGGSPTSSHLKGLAADIRLAAKDREKIISACRKVFARRGIGAGFIHVDIDGAKPNAEWTY